jgi:hypothetical protein
MTDVTDLIEKLKRGSGKPDLDLMDAIEAFGEVNNLDEQQWNEVCKAALNRMLDALSYNGAVGATG